MGTTNIKFISIIFVAFLMSATIVSAFSLIDIFTGERTTTQEANTAQRNADSYEATRTRASSIPTRENEDIIEREVIESEVIKEEINIEDVPKVDTLTAFEEELIIPEIYEEEEEEPEPIDKYADWPSNGEIEIYEANFNIDSLYSIKIINEFLYKRHCIELSAGQNYMSNEAVRPQSKQFETFPLGSLTICYKDLDDAMTMYNLIKNRISDEINHWQHTISAKYPGKCEYSTYGLEKPTFMCYTGYGYSGLSLAIYERIEQ